jgi:hypothetical protein
VLHDMHLYDSIIIKVHEALRQASFCNMKMHLWFRFVLSTHLIKLVLLVFLIFESTTAATLPEVPVNMFESCCPRTNPSLQVLAVIILLALAGSITMMRRGSARDDRDDDDGSKHVGVFGNDDDGLQHGGVFGNDVNEGAFARDSDEIYESDSEDADDPEYVDEISDDAAYDSDSSQSSEGAKNPWAVNQDFTAEIYERGYRFPAFMSYKELYDTINLKHQMQGGGEPLKAKATFKNSEDPLPFQIHFYCSHLRNHVTDDHKPPKNASSGRASRAREDRRSGFTQCKYSITVRLDTEYDPHLAEGVTDEASPLRGLKSETRARWFVDSHADFVLDNRRRNFKTSCFCHSGHCKRNLVIGQVTPVIRQFIHTSARQCVPISSIAAQVFEKHNIYLTYQQIHYELCEGCPDVNVSIGGITSRSESTVRRNPCEALLDWLRNEDDQTWVALVENMDESSSGKIQFETWHGDSSIKEETCSKKEEFEFNSCLKAKEARSGAEQEMHHGRQYDTSRFVKLGQSNAKYFLVAICWASKDETRVCAAYPEVLVVDSKANTNKLKHAFFCAVGIDGNHNNAVLFRAWLPNNTEDAYAWMLNTAIKILFKPEFLARVKFVMSDNCHTMGPVLEDACQQGETFPNAAAFICVYHLERNFFQEFGVSSRGRWQLKPSRMRKKKGGTIDWAYGWQKQCVNAIYRMQKCETAAELNECKKWIATFISAAPDMHSDLKRSVRMFFQRKYALRSQWVLAFRMKRRGFNVAASSRVEGEFGVINKLNMSGAMNFRTGITKMRFSASNRQNSKRAKAERWSSTQVIREPNCPMTSKEFKSLDESLTPFYRNSVEQQVMAADKFLTARLIESNGDAEMIFKVWSPTAHGDEDISGSDESSSDNDGEDGAILHAPQAFPSVVHEELHPDFDDPRDAIPSPAPSTHVTCDEFNWLRVRTVVLTLSEGGAWVMKCSCGYLERTCTPCRHTFCVTKMIVHHYGVKFLRFNRRCYKGFYYLAVCSAEELDVTDGHMDVYPVLPKSLVDAWLLTNPVHTADDVPHEGILNNEDTQYDDAAPIEDGRGNELRRPDQPKRRAANATSLNGQMMNILDLLGPVSVNASGYNDFADYLNEYSEQLARAPRQSAPGRGQQNRKIGPADLGSGSKPKHASKHGAVPSLMPTSAADKIRHPALRVPCAEETRIEALHRGIKIAGVRDGTFVEVYPMKSAPPTDRWFLKVVDGHVVGTSKKLSLAAGLWCCTNTLRLDPKQREVVSIEIKTILDEGPAAKFEIIGSTGRVLPKVVHAATAGISTAHTAPPLPSSKHRSAVATSNVESAPQTPPLSSEISPWKEMPLGWKSQNGRIAPGSIDFVLRQKSTTVASVACGVLRKAMTTANVPQVQSAKNKNDLIELMCKFNCEYSNGLIHAAKTASPAALRPVPSGQSQEQDESVDLEALYHRVGRDRARGPGQTPTTATDYFFKKTEESVKSVSLENLRQAMKLKKLVGVDACREKGDLIRLMVAQDISYDVAVVISDNSSDSSAPISRGAIALAKQTALSAAAALAACPKRPRETLDMAVPSAGKTLRQQRIDAIGPSLPSSKPVVLKQFDGLDSD